jgi:hypothetical protein
LDAPLWRVALARHDHRLAVEVAGEVQDAPAADPVLMPLAVAPVEIVDAHAGRAARALPVLVDRAAAGLARDLVLTLLLAVLPCDRPLADPEIELPELPRGARHGPLCGRRLLLLLTLRARRGRERQRENDEQCSHDLHLANF